MRLSWANLKRRPIHTFLTGITVVVASAILFISLAAVDGLNKGLSGGIKRLGADIIVLPEQARANYEEQILFSGVPVKTYMSDDINRKIAAIPGVRKTSPQFFVQTLNKSCCTLEEATRLVGIDEKSDFVIKPWLDDQGIASLGKNEMIIGAKIPPPLGNQGVILGQKFKVVGRLEPSGGGMDQTIFIPIKTAKRLAKSMPYFSGLRSGKVKPNELISTVMVRLSDQSKTNEVAEKIAEKGSLRVIIASKFLRSTAVYVGLLRQVLLSLSGLLLLVSLLAVTGRFLAMVFERRGEIGVYRALGARKSDIFKLFLWEAVLLTSIGSLVGIALGVISLEGLALVLSDLAVLPFLSPTPQQFVVFGSITMAVILSTGALASLYPAYLCARQDAATAIARGDLE